jgi:hypothetical protein
LRKLTVAVGGWLLRQRGWHLALSLWFMFFPTLLALEVFGFFAGGGYAHHRVDVPALLLAVAIVLLVPPAIAVGLARYLRRGRLEPGWSQPGNDGQAVGPNNSHARG